MHMLGWQSWLIKMNVLLEQHEVYIALQLICPTSLQLFSKPNSVTQLAEVSLGEQQYGKLDQSLKKN